MADSIPFPSQTRPIRVLVVDDSKALLAAVQNLLETVPDVVVVGTAEDGQSAVEQAEMLRPDAIIMDIEMPRMSGLQATRMMRERGLPVHILLISIHFGDEMLQVCRAYGADSFLSKIRLSPHELERQLKQILVEQPATVTR
jgi:DNA-binding NarL/FixJ family response regulator